MRRLGCAVLITTSCALTLPAANAARPLTTDDAGVLNTAQCELDTFVERSRVQGEPSYLGGSLQAGCGIGLNTQLSVVGARFDGDPSTTHLGLTGKTALIELTESGPGFTIGYAFDWARQSEQPFRLDTGLLIAIATFPFEKNWFGHVNAGWQRTQMPRENALFWGLAIEREAVADSRVDLMAEAYGAGESSPWFALGARFHAIEQRLSINGSIAIKPRSEREARTTIGARLAF